MDHWEKHICITTLLLVLFYKQVSFRDRLGRHNLRVAAGEGSGGMP